MNHGRRRAHVSMRFKGFKPTPELALSRAAIVPRSFAHERTRAGEERKRLQTSLPGIEGFDWNLRMTMHTDNVKIIAGEQIVVSEYFFGGRRNRLNMSGCNGNCDGRSQLSVCFRIALDVIVEGQYECTSKTKFAILFKHGQS